MSVLDSLLDGWDNRALTVHRLSTNYQVLVGLSAQLDQQSTTADNVRDMHTIRDAEGDALDHTARAVDLQRRSGESDDVFRLRIMLQYLLNAMDGTTEEIESFLHVLFNAEIGQIILDRDFVNQPGTLLVETDVTLIEESPLDSDVVIDFIEQTIAAGHRVVVEATGTFEITDETDTNLHDEEKGLTADNIDTGGTLTRDLTT